MREEFNRRLDLAVIYELPYKEGWQTDRGKMLILYGYPAEIRRSPFSPTGEPKYEIWVYRDSPGDPDAVEVVFEDATDSGEFILTTEVVLRRAPSLEPVKPWVAERGEDNLP